MRKYEFLGHETGLEDQLAILMVRSSVRVEVAGEDGESLAKFGDDGTERVEFIAESIISGFEFTVTIR